MDLRAAVLEDRKVRLEPYADANRSEVRAALDCDPSAWDLFSVSGRGEHFDAWWREATTSPDRISFAVRRRSDERVIGTTSFLGISPQHRSVEIGATFYGPADRGGEVNPRCKRLLLTHAFAAGANRVQLVTDGRNERSQAAIAKLGAVREGVLRRHKITWTGHVRDTVVYSIIAEEWPSVLQRLDERIGD